MWEHLNTRKIKTQRDEFHCTKSLAVIIKYAHLDPNNFPSQRSFFTSPRNPLVIVEDSVPLFPLRKILGKRKVVYIMNIYKTYK